MWRRCFSWRTRTDRKGPANGGVSSKSGVVEPSNLFRKLKARADFLGNFNAGSEDETDRLKELEDRVGSTLGEAGVRAPSADRGNSADIRNTHRSSDLVGPLEGAHPLTGSPLSACRIKKPLLRLNSIHHS